MYGVIVFSRNKIYDLLVTPTKSEVRVVSIGNLSVGGTGKTPMCLWILKKAMALDLKVAVFLRGYGSRDGISDEAELYGQVLGSSHVYVNPSRRESLRKVQNQNYDLILMDDAFQHRKVHRDIDLVLTDSTRFIMDDCLMPLGTLREPLRGLKRAHALVITRCENQTPEQLQLKKERVHHRFPHLYLTQAKTVVSHIQPFQDAFPWQSHLKVFLFSAIGDPEKFRFTVAGQKIHIVGERVFRDHHFISEDEIREMESVAVACGADAFMTTAKDAVKIPGNTTFPVYVLHVELSIDQEQDFFRMVIGA